MEKRNANVVTLPTKNPHNCLGLVKCHTYWASPVTPQEEYFNVGDYAYGKNNSQGVFDFFEPQTMYITIDEEPKLGGWGIRKGKVRQILTSTRWKYEYKKIIASTDKVLAHLGRPSPKFIKEYADQGGIDEVLVDFVQDVRVTDPECPIGIGGYWTYTARVDFDSYICISRIKESYTRDEVATLIMDTALEFGIYNPPKDDGTTAEQITIWTKKSL